MLLLCASGAAVHGQAGIVLQCTYPNRVHMRGCIRVFSPTNTEKNEDDAAVQESSKQLSYSAYRPDVTSSFSRSCDWQELQGQGCRARICHRSFS